MKTRMLQKERLGCWPELEKNTGGILVSCLAWLVKDEDSYLTFQLGSLSPNPTSTCSQNMILYGSGFVVAAHRVPSPEFFSNSELSNVFLEAGGVH